jgi:ATP-dependent DNA ligase
MLPGLPASGARTRRRTDPASAVSYVVLDLLACEGLPTTTLRYSRQRELLEQLTLEQRPAIQLVAAFDDGEALFQVVCEPAGRTGVG